VACFDARSIGATAMRYHAMLPDRAERTALAFQLELCALTKSVPGGRVLFRDLSLRVAAGELVAIVGESGSGKSTLLNIAAGLDACEAGQILIGGDDLGALDDRGLTELRRRRIGFVFQAFHILPYLTLRRNVGLPLALASCNTSEIIARADAILDQVGLGSRGDDYARDLSGGELQRVAIARALIHRPALILADEPTGSLDAETATRILQLFADSTRNSGSAGLLVTHSAAAAAIADRTLVLTASGLAPFDG
jgi:putative ABC transport system ATP-binding protein